jgi:MFS family permease
MTSCNFVGLAAGPALTGALVQYAPAPLHLTFWAYLALLAATALPVALARETVGPRTAPIVLKPRLGVPPQIRLAFIAPALTAFAAMAVVGFYAALGPSLMRQDLHIANRAVGGLAVSELFVVGAAAIVASRRLSARAGMLAGMALAPVGLALLAAAQRLASLPLLLAGTAVCGACAALGYRGSLQVVNDLAPPDRKSEVVSVYFGCGFLGNALPVIGVGVLSQATGARLADTVFAGVISAVALGALASDLAFGAAHRGGRSVPKGA